MSVSSVLHRSCDSDLGCALQVTVSTSDSCCCPLQLFRVVAHWVAMRSWSLVRLNTSLERSVESPLASVCSLDKEKVFPRIDNAETSTSREKHAHLLGDLPLARSWSLALRARWSPRTDAHLFLFWLPTVPAVSSERRLTLLVSCPPGACLNRSLLRAMSRQVPAATAPPFLWSAGQPYAYAVGVSPDWCSPASLVVLLPLVTRKVNWSRK